MTFPGVHRETPIRERPSTHGYEDFIEGHRPLKLGDVDIDKGAILPLGETAREWQKLRTGRETALPTWSEGRPHVRLTDSHLLDINEGFKKITPAMSESPEDHLVLSNSNSCRSTNDSPG